MGDVSGPICNRLDLRRRGMFQEIETNVKEGKRSGDNTYGLRCKI